MAEIGHFFVDVLRDVRRGDTMLHAAPVTHGSGGFLLPHLIRSARNVIQPRFDPEHLSSSRSASARPPPSSCRR
jgi:hypothetical protein